MTKPDDILIRATEAALIITALKLFIQRLQSDRTEKNAVTTDATIAFIKIVKKKYYPMSKTVIKKDLNGRFIPIIQTKN